MRLTGISLLCCMGCYLSHPLDPDRDASTDATLLDVLRIDTSVRPDAGPPPPSPDICCTAMCEGEGGQCGIDLCGQVVRLLCQSPGSEEACSVGFVGCDEGGDCVGGEVCRTDALDPFRYLCRPPLEDCSDPASTARCDYACGGNADCSPAAPTCIGVGFDRIEECSRLGFCYR